MSEDRGAPIAGSRYVRDFCVTCREPIRVSSKLVGQVTCERCAGRCPTSDCGGGHRTPRQIEGRKKTHS